MYHLGGCPGFPPRSSFFFFHPLLPFFVTYQRKKTAGPNPIRRLPISLSPSFSFASPCISAVHICLVVLFPVRFNTRVIRPYCRRTEATFMTYRHTASKLNPEGHTKSSGTRWISAVFVRKLERYCKVLIH